MSSQTANKDSTKDALRKANIKKIQDDLQVLSNDFREGEMLMDYIRSNISGNSKREKFFNRPGKTYGTVYSKAAPMSRFKNTK